MKKITLTILVLLLLVPAVFAAPNIVETFHTLTESPQGTLVTTVTLRNTGDQNSKSFVYETQALGVASFTIVNLAQSTCNNAYPQNQHVLVPVLTPNQEITFSIKTVLPRAIYNVYGVSYNSCCWIEGVPLNSCSPVQPYAYAGGTVNLGQISIHAPSQPQDLPGDGVCGPTETVRTSPYDCPGYCGDAFCNSANNKETTNNCPTDCGTPPPVCNSNGACEPLRGENFVNCDADCPVPPDPNPPLPPGPIVPFGGWIVPVFGVLALLAGVYLFMRKK